MKKALIYLTLIVLAFLNSRDASAIQRFPKPEFESGYTQPETLLPEPRAEMLAYMDVAALLLALSITSWFVIRKRSRSGVFFTSMVALAYFGFYRKGCVCSVGSLQNVALALFDSSYAIPVTVTLFFLVPLIFTLFYGRTFCAGVCPFGALQDLVAFNPQRMGVRLNAVFGMIPYIYLGLAVLYAATGTDFIICRYDPFVGIFRMNASFGMFVFAGILLVSGVFIARPYCRFLCPYGVLLNWMSRFSRKHLTITPSACIQCRLCEDSCPYDAIDIPSEVRNPDSRKQRVRKLIFISILIPFLVALGAYTGYLVHEPLAGVHKDVRLARQILNPEKGVNVTESFEIQAYKSSGKAMPEALNAALTVVGKFRKGSLLIGGFLGLVFGLLIASKMLRKYTPDYTPHKGRCFSCARCVDYCPVKSES